MKLLRSSSRHLSHYYETSEGGADTTKYIHELVKLGVDMEYIVDIDLQIRDEVCGV